jgi:hypothetical protein
MTSLSRQKFLRNRIKRHFLDSVSGKLGSENKKGAFFMTEKKVILSIWAAVIALLIGSMLLAGILASSRPEYRARPGLETCAVEETELYDAQH